MAETEEFSLGRDQEGRPALLWQGAVLGYLARGRSLLQPQFKPARAVAGLEGDDLRAISERAESWIQEQLAKHMGGLVALNQLAADAATDGVVRALAARLADAGGIAGRQFLADTLTALPKEARGAARKAGIVFGALDVYHHAVLKPAAARWRAALFSAQTEKPMPDLPPESAVHLKDWNFASAADCRNAGYRRVGNEYVRIDLAERVIKKAHEARGQAMEFGMDMAFATSLGLGEEGLQALMRDAGFRRIEGLSAQTDAAVAESATAGDSVAEAQAVPEEMVQAETEAPAAETEAVAEGVADDVPVAAPEPAEVVEENAVPAEAVAPAAGSEQPANLTYWRWIGIRKAKPAPRPARTQERHPKKGGKPVQSRPAAAAPAKPKNEAPSALALQLAALKEKMGG